MKRITKYLFILFTLVFFIGCSQRELTTKEVAFSSQFFGNSIKYEKIEIQKGGVSNIFTENGATVIDNLVSFNSKRYLDDIADSLYFDDKMLFIHELTHVWQYQNKIVNKKNIPYTWRLAAAEHIKYGKDVYTYPPLKITDCFKNFRFEQQGKIMQDYTMIYFIGTPKQKEIYKKVIYDNNCGINKELFLNKKFLKFKDK